MSDDHDPLQHHHGRPEGSLVAQVPLAAHDAGDHSGRREPGRHGRHHQGHGKRDEGDHDRHGRRRQGPARTTGGSRRAGTSGRSGSRPHPGGCPRFGPKRAAAAPGFPRDGGGRCHSHPGRKVQRPLRVRGGLPGRARNESPHAGAWPLLHRPRRRAGQRRLRHRHRHSRRPVRLAREDRPARSSPWAR